VLPEIVCEALRPTPYLKRVMGRLSVKALTWKNNPNPYYNLNLLQTKAYKIMLQNKGLTVVANP